MYAMMGIMLIVMLGLMLFVILGQVQQNKTNNSMRYAIATLNSEVNTLTRIMETQEFEIKQLKQQVDIHRRIINSTVRRNIKSS